MNPRRAARPVAALLALALGAALPAVEASLPPLVVIEHDTLVLKNNDRIPGTLVERRADGVLFQTLGKTGAILYQKGDVADIEPRQTAAQAVERRGAIQLERKDQIGLRQSVLWGRANKAPEAALALAQQASALFPTDTEMGGMVLAMLEEQGRGAEVEPVAAALLKANPTFEPAYVALARALRAANRLDELAAVTDRFLQQRPTSDPANSIKAELAEVRDPRAANEAHRKRWELHKNPDAGLGYARTCLPLGQWQNALKTATALSAANQHVEAARAVAGIAHLALGDVARARAALAQAVQDADKLPPDLALWSRHDLGVAMWRGGERDPAREHWTRLDDPVARLALAIAERKPADEAQFADRPSVQAVAREHNACLALQELKHERALASLDPKADDRQRFLADVAQVLKSSGSEASVRMLVATPGAESLRWQAYGHLIAKRWADAEAVLAKLPEDDGWAAVYRVYAAAGLKDAPRAKDLFRKIATAKDAPQEYVSELAAEYAAENDELVKEEFDWAEGDAMATGWQQQALETNIRVHALGGQLVFAGTQTVSRDPVTRAWRMAQADRIRAVEVAFDTAGMGGAQTGLELLDQPRRNGVALGILAENKLGWRPLRNGQWGQWQTIPLRIEGTKPVLRVEFMAGRVSAVRPDRGSERYTIGDAPLPTTGLIAVGAFGTAEPGTAWKVGLESFTVQMKPVVQRGR